jgi:hypothetical protein
VEMIKMAWPVRACLSLFFLYFHRHLDDSIQSKGAFR